MLYEVNFLFLGSTLGFRGGGALQGPFKSVATAAGLREMGISCPENSAQNLGPLQSHRPSVCASASENRPQL